MEEEKPIERVRLIYEIPKDQPKIEGWPSPKIEAIPMKWTKPEIKDVAEPNLLPYAPNDVAVKAPVNYKALIGWIIILIIATLIAILS